MISLWDVSSSYIDWTFIKAIKEYILQLNILFKVWFNDARNQNRQISGLCPPPFGCIIEDSSGLLSHSPAASCLLFLDELKNPILLVLSQGGIPQPLIRPCIFSCTVSFYSGLGSVGKVCLSPVAQCREV